jgi:hypothetical protein
MPKNSRWILVYDFETDSPNPETCNPTEIAAVPIDPKTLEVKKDDIFSIKVKPPGIDKEDYFIPEREKTIQWTANTRGMSYEEVVEMWKGGTAQKIAWKNFVKYCERFHCRKKPGQWSTEPIAAGYNIIGFDNVIAGRMAEEHKTKYPFSKVNKLDMMDCIFWWTESLEEPENYKMDTLREWFKMEATGKAHEAAVDVIEEAALIKRFLQFHRMQASVEKFKGSFKGVKI